MSESKSKSWRDFYNVHPAADLVPMLGDCELEELAKDIKANGLQQPLVFDSYGDEAVLVDGRNRAAALRRLGRKPVHPRPHPGAARPRALVLKDRQRENPIAYIMSVNVHRRRLTRQQKLVRSERRRGARLEAEHGARLGSGCTPPSKPRPSRRYGAGARAAQAWPSSAGHESGAHSVGAHPGPPYAAPMSRRCVLMLAAVAVTNCAASVALARSRSEDQMR